LIREFEKKRVGKKLVHGKLGLIDRGTPGGMH